MADKLYIVDGMSHIYRAYHAIKGLTNARGTPTNAVYGFTNMLRKLIQEENPEYLGVAIDTRGPTVRHEQYDQYKATRRPIPEDLVEQFPLILQVCEVLRIPVIFHDRYEADDVIGTLAKKAVLEGLEVVIVSTDKDMFQLVNEHVTVLDTRNSTRLDADKVKEKFGVLPKQVVDVLSLVGDSSDNVPGAPGIGSKGARDLIGKFGSLDELLARRQEVARKSYRESLGENEELILQSRDLVTIHDDLELELDLESLRLSEPNLEEARKLFSELEFAGLLKEFLPATPPRSSHYRKLARPEDLGSIEEALGDRASVTLRFPNGSYLEGALEGLALSCDSGGAWYLPGELLEQAPESVAQILKRPKKWLIHDLKPLYFAKEHYGWELQEVFQDVMLMAYLLNPNQTDFSLERLALDHLQEKLQPPLGEDEGLFEDAQAMSACERAEVTGRLAEVLDPLIAEKELEALLREIEIPLVPVLASMEEYGVRVDCEFLKEMSETSELEIASLTKEIFSIAGREFNINSPRQLSTVLFEELHLPGRGKTRKAGHYATGVEVLENLAEDYEIARLILEFRELSKLKNTYLDALPRLVNPRTNRIHTSYNQMVAATGRLSSSNPNMQNIPIKSKLGREIRKAFVAEPGSLIMSADYSQIELRVMAHLAGDPVLIESFLKEEDIHERTAREVFGINAMMNPEEYRRHAKVINFGIMYGLSAFGLAKSLKIERKDAQKFIDQYFERYEKVREWIDRTLELAEQEGCVRTLFGRIRPIPEIRSKNANLRKFAERTAINAPIQGTAADLIKLAMVNIAAELEDRSLSSRLVSQVHDELVLEVKEEEVDPVRELVADKMETVASLDVPLSVDLGVGKSWFEAK